MCRVSQDQKPTVAHHKSMNSVEVSAMSTRYTAITKLLIGLSLAGLGLSLSATTVFAKSKTDAAESRTVKVSWTVAGSAGVADAEGCSQCPIQLIVDKKTKFIHARKKLSVKAIEHYSGQPGTVIYTIADKHALKVVW